MKANNSLFLIFLLLAITSCESNDRKESATYSSPLANSPIADYELLFIGNSHSSVNNLPDLVATLIEKGTGKTANSALAPGWNFLAERIGDGVTQPTIESRQWTHIILQAQKYSSSGLYSYPTTAAEEWIRRIKTQRAIPIFFPEWPRRGNFEEGQRVHDLHLYIASQQAACVAPIGLAWDESIAINPALDLHAPDGNHSNLKGALLSAYVFYQLMTQNSAAELPYIQEININATTQKQLRETASLVTDNHCCL